MADNRYITNGQWFSGKSLEPTASTKIRDRKTKENLQNFSSGSNYPLEKSEAVARWRSAKKLC